MITENFQCFVESGKILFYFCDQRRDKNLSGNGVRSLRNENVSVHILENLETIGLEIQIFQMLLEKCLCH